MRDLIHRAGFSSIVYIVVLSQINRGNLTCKSRPPLISIDPHQVVHAVVEKAENRQVL